MYDYMKALQRQFETDCQSIRNLNDEVNRTHKELSSRLAKEYIGSSASSLWMPQARR